jgi:hypothetical protein
MTTSKKIERKEFLASAVAVLGTVTLGGCSGDDDGGGGGTGNTGGTGSGGTAAGMGGAGSGGTSGGGTGGGGMNCGGDPAPMSGTGMLVCVAVTDNCDHSHPLTIPPSDIEAGFQTAPYILQDGGTGHTHTLELDSYEFVYLNAGVAMEHESTVTLGHSHLCRMNCAR